MIRELGRGDSQHAEKLFEGHEPAAGVEVAEPISGDTTVGHALAFCEALEAAAGLAVPERAKHLRVVRLEMEPLYNHVADVGMIARVMADAGGRLSRVKVIDPSFLYWRPLSSEHC